MIDDETGRLPTPRRFAELSWRGRFARLVWYAALAALAAVAGLAMIVGSPWSSVLGLFAVIAWIAVIVGAGWIVGRWYGLLALGMFAALFALSLLAAISWPAISDAFDVPSVAAIAWLFLLAGIAWLARLVWYAVTDGPPWPDWLRVLAGFVALQVIGGLAFLLTWLAGLAFDVDVDLDAVPRWTAAALVVAALYYAVWRHNDGILLLTAGLLLLVAFEVAMRMHSAVVWGAAVLFGAAVLYGTLRISMWSGRRRRRDG